MNPIDNYYIQQVGSGLSGFQGQRYQRGSGFWGSLWSKVGFPVLKFLGRQAAASGIGLATDALEGRDMKQSAMSHLKAGGKNTLGQLQKMLDQSGSGRKRRRHFPKRTIKRKKRQVKRLVSKRTVKKKRRRRKKKSEEWL